MLTPDMRQAIIWAEDGLFLWRICARRQLVKIKGMCWIGKAGHVLRGTCCHLSLWQLFPTVTPFMFNACEQFYKIMRKDTMPKQNKSSRPLYILRFAVVALHLLHYLKKIYHQVSNHSSAWLWSNYPSVVALRISFHNHVDVSESIELLKCLSGTYCRGGCPRLSKFSQLCFMGYMGLYVFSFLISLVMIVRIRELYLILSSSNRK